MLDRCKERSCRLFPLIDIRERSFHIALRSFHFGKAELFIESMSIAGQQHPSAKSLKFWVINHGLHEPFTQSLSTKWLQDEHIAYIGKGSIVGNNACIANLLLSPIQAK